MVRYFPQILCLSLDNIKNKINELINLGYSYNEVIVITKNNPTVYGFKTYSYYGSVSCEINVPNIVFENVLLDYIPFLLIVVRSGSSLLFLFHKNLLFFLL